MFTGVLIAESVRDRSALGRLRIVETRSVDIDDAATGQPSVWTLIRFELDDADAAATAEALAGALIEGPWYVDFNDGERSYVVFAGRVFTYVRGDEVTLAETRNHARDHGIPESQLDWAVP